MGGTARAHLGHLNQNSLRCVLIGVLERPIRRLRRLHPPLRGVGHRPRASLARPWIDVPGALGGFVLALVAACGAGDAAGPFVALPGAAALPGNQVASDFTRAGGFFAAPVPSEDLRRAGGVDVAAWPNPGDNDLIGQLRDVVGADAGGFPISATVYFRLDGAPHEASMPTLAASVDAGATVFLADVDPSSPARGHRVPVEVAFHDDGGPYGAPNLLSVLPLQGAPLRPDTLHAAVVRRSLGDAGGAPLGRSAELAALLAGEPLAGLDATARAAYDEALEQLVAGGLDPDDVAGITVFRTGDPTAGLREYVAAARPYGPLAATAFAAREVFEGYCVYEATVAMPTFQHGDAPYLGGPESGGDWRRDAAGAPLLAGHETARLVVTVPRREAPAAGFPTVVFIRTGGGGDRPLVDRGRHGENHGPALVPGSGPARDFAAVGYAGVSVDGPLGGLRNATGGDEQFLIFNVTNARAMRDNIRESALELALLPDLLARLAVPTGDCPGAPATARFDGDHLALMGHSMGATIAPLVLAVEPRYRAMILSGEGGSYIQQIPYKQQPIDVAPLAQSLLGYADRAITPPDPALCLLQWAAEPADPQVYAPLVRAGGAHVLLIQGIVDHYNLPPMVNAVSLPLGLDLAGPALDAAEPRLAHFRPLGELLPLVGGRTRDLPVDDATGPTRVVVQQAEDGIEDGHEVVFQTEPPKHLYRCFLADLAADRAPRVVAFGGEDDPCD